MRLLQRVKVDLAKTRPKGVARADSTKRLFQPSPIILERDEFFKIEHITGAGRPHGSLKPNARPPTSQSCCYS
jgi:hypothetical protein